MIMKTPDDGGLNQAFAQLPEPPVTHADWRTRGMSQERRRFTAESQAALTGLDLHPREVFLRMHQAATLQGGPGPVFLRRRLHLGTHTSRVPITDADQTHEEEANGLYFG